MYLRLNSSHVPMKWLKTANEYNIAKDKSGILIQGQIEGGYLRALPVMVQRNAVHIVPNPKLGFNGFVVATEDDGIYQPEVKLTKARQELAETLDWHFKIMFLPVSVPYSD